MVPLSLGYGSHFHDPTGGSRHHIQDLSSEVEALGRIDQQPPREISWKVNRVLVPIFHWLEFRELDHTQLQVRLRNVVFFFSRIVKVRDLNLV